MNTCSSPNPHRTGKAYTHIIYTQKMLKVCSLFEPFLRFCKCICVERKDQYDEELVRKRLRMDDEENGGVVRLDQMVPKAEGKTNCQEKMYYLDASKEGNVARFINVSRIFHRSKLSVLMIGLCPNMSSAFDPTAQLQSQPLCPECVCRYTRSQIPINCLLYMQVSSSGG